MPDEIRCNYCRTIIDPANVDPERELAICGACGRLVDMRRARAASAKGAVPKGPRSRATVELPAGMSVETGPELVIRRRWLRSKHWFLLVLFGTAAAYVGYLWATIETNGWLVVGTIFVASWNYSLLAMFVNRTTVSADANGVRVEHGPLPSLFGRKASAAKSDITQLYAVKWGALYAVEAKLRSGRIARLVHPLATPEQAWFVEQELERALGLEDKAVAGELGDEDRFVGVDGKPAPSASSSAFLSLAIPLLIGGMVALFFMMTGTTVSGRLDAGGALGAWAFEPDDCTSGQREGFGGVVLSSSKHSGRVVRVVRDPVRGSLVVVADNAHPNQVVSNESCSMFQVDVERTNTNINDIWAVDGRVTLKCKELSGSVVFEGCH
jgi:hypothetical protein